MIRDPKRIEDFCKRLATAWKQVPDLRFFQLIDDVIVISLGRDAFYVEDDEAIKVIEQFVDEVALSDNEEYMGGF